MRIMIPKVVPIIPEAILTHLMEVLVWAQERALQHEGIDQLQLAFLRRAKHHREVTFTEVARYTGADKDSINRAARFLKNSELAIVEPIADDKRRRKLKLTQFGRKRLKAVEQHFLDIVLAEIGHAGPPAKRAEKWKWCPVSQETTSACN